MSHLILPDWVDRKEWNSIKNCCRVCVKCGFFDDLTQDGKIAFMKDSLSA